MKYIKLPINFYNIAKGAKSPSCSMEESIAQHLYLLITSRYGEVSGNNTFGCDIWELEFNQLVKTHKWEEQVKSSLEKSILINEKRLKDVEVKISLTEVDYEFKNKGYSQVRRKADIHIAGLILENNQDFQFGMSLYISPLAQ